MKKLLKKKGFTLIELIVVIAVLGILAVIAVPKFSDVQKNARIKADAATAKQIINAARIYEAEKNISVGTVTLTNVGTLMQVPSNTQSGTKGAFALDVSTPTDYKVTWSTGASYTEAGVLTSPTD